MKTSRLSEYMCLRFMTVSLRHGLVIDSSNGVAVAAFFCSVLMQQFTEQAWAMEFYIISSHIGNFDLPYQRHCTICRRSEL